MSFLSEPEPERGRPAEVAPGIRRIVAPNPSVMTYWGTNTYLIEASLTGAGSGLLLLDPGPDDAAHVESVLAAAAGRIAAILVSHTHHDHVGAAAALRAATGAPLVGFHRPHAEGFVADVGLHDGEEAYGWTAVHTPGHAPDHLVFAGPGGVAFSADHVMSWSSSVVPPPPGGSMQDYFASLRRMLERDDRLYLPGHGPPLPSPHGFVADLLTHREAREGAILRALGPEPQSSASLMRALYSKIDPTLQRAAEANVRSHLHKLGQEGQAVDTGAGWVRVIR